MLTREQIIEIRGAITLGDVDAAKKLAQDEAEAGLRAIFRRAQKLGLVAADTGYEDFLDLVLIEDIKALATPEVTGPLVPTPELSPDSAATGE